MSYDDVANANENPFKGQLFNRPEGEDVYKGCKVDYRGKDVTPQNFMNVMKGDASSMANIGTGKVLKSDENSKVFVFFTDHGAPGLVAFPTQMLYADQLNKTLEHMYTNKMYN